MDTNLIEAGPSQVKQGIEWSRVTWYSQLLAIALALGIFGLGLWIGTQVHSSQTLSQDREQERANNSATLQDTATQSAKTTFTKFELENSVPGCTDFDSATGQYVGLCEKTLARTLYEGTPVTVLDGVLERFREQTSDSEKGTELEIFYQSPEHGKVIFSTICHCDRGAHLYSFDTTSLVFTKLAHGRLDSSFGDLMSPDHRKIVRMDPEGKKLLLTDVLLDNETTVVTVQGNENLTDQINAFGGDPMGSYAWQGTSTIEYNVYEGNVPDNAKQYESRKPLQTRIYVLSESPSTE